MKSLFKTTVLALILTISFSLNANSQSIKLLGSDLANGAINGLALGGATMALQNSPDGAPLRVGLGAGILYGLGVGIYDNSIITKGEQFYISGTFNDGNNSTIIVLLDTFYGAVGGAAIGSAISLIGNNPILDGIQYGGGAGAWLGFGFGLIDSFVLAEGPDDLRASVQTPARQNAEGMIQYTTGSKNVSLGFIHPTVISQKEVTSQNIKINYTVGMEVVNLKVDF